MTEPTGDRAFSGSIPQIYQQHLVPLIFEPYAEDLGKRLAGRPLARVLEVAAGTGVVTRCLAATLPRTTEIVATDLNQAMLDHGATVRTDRPIVWRQADAMQLPFDAGSFDAVVCQFGFMFFPEKGKAFGEARRVLKPGGMLLFNVWDRLADNEIADAITTALAKVFAADPPRFLARTPYGYHDRAAIERDVAAGGFTAKPKIATVTARSRTSSAHIAALAYCQGTPLRAEIEARGAQRMGEATEAAAAGIAARFGAGPVDAKIQALVVTVEK